MQKTKDIVKFIAVLILLFIFQQFASFIGGQVANHVNYSFIDKDNTFAWISIHHIVQMVLGLLAIFVLYIAFHFNFYLKPASSSSGIKYVGIFTIVTLVAVVICYIIFYAFNFNTPYNFPLNTRNIAGTLGFQLLLSGPSEEIVFRALPFTVLAAIMPENNKKRNAVVILVVTSLLFSLAHISWATDPFTLSFSWFQLIYTFIFGFVYAITYIKSKSVIYPMIMHSVSNIIMIGLGYVFAVLA